MKWLDKDRFVVLLTVSELRTMLLTRAFTFEGHRIRAIELVDSKPAVEKAVTKVLEALNDLENTFAHYHGGKS